MRSLSDGNWQGANAPPVFSNVMYGQTGFLTAGLIGLVLVLLGPRPLVAPLGSLPGPLRAIRVAIPPWHWSS